MQCLSDHLASYLDRVRSLEADNRRQRLESKIWEQLEKKGPQVTDCGCGFKTKALMEELLFMKSHEEKVSGLQNQIANSELTVELDAPKSQDLSKLIVGIWAQNDKLAPKNREGLDEYWSQQTEESTCTVVTSQTAE